VTDLEGSFNQINVTIEKVPITTALSAILNVGQFGIDIQSTTGPCSPPGLRKIRSLRFPNIPPKTSPRPSAHFIESMRVVKYKIPAATAIEKPDRKIVLLVAKLKAAPVLKINSNLRKLPMTLTGSSLSAYTATYFVK